MWRVAVRPRWLALLVVVLFAATGMARLGEWQLHRAQQQGAAAQRAQRDRPAVALASLLAPQTAFPADAADRRVIVSGRWDGGGQLLVAGRRLDGASGWWVLTPLRLADGSGVGVVRGWTATPSDAAVSPSALPTGQVRVEGVLEPGEAAVDRAPGQTSGLPAGQLDRIDPAVLVQQWDYPQYTGFLISTSPSAGVRLVPAIPAGSGLAWQNLSYAVQWWLFALFGVFLWWRLVRDDHRGLLRPAPGPASGRPGSPVSTGAHP